MKFSIIVPIYNCEAYLAAALDSVLAQTCPDWECICVDDGSTDESGRIADEYAAKDARICVIHQKNGGEGAARNAGMDAAKGDWIYFLDSDDVLNEGTLAECERMIAENPAADYVSVQLVEFADGMSPNWAQPTACATRVYDLRESVDVEPYGMHVWCVAYRRELALSIKFGDLKIGADRVYIAEILEKANQAVFSDYIGYGYRARIGSAVNTRYTAEKFLHNLRHRMKWVEIFRVTRKHYAPSIIAGYAKSHTEYMGSKFFEMDGPNQRLAASEWFDALKDSARFPAWPMWPRFVMRVCGAVRLRFVAWVLCYLPHWLKLHGVNRRLVVARKPLVGGGG